MVKHAKTDNFKNKLEVKRHDPKRFWKGINELIANKSKSNDLILSVNQDNNTIEEGETGNYINDFFFYKYWTRFSRTIYY